MSATRYTRLFNSIIMRLNSIRTLDEQERKRDILYGALLCTFFLVVPLIMGPIAFAYERYALGIVFFLANWGIGLCIGLARRRTIIRDFYQTPTDEVPVRIERIDYPPLPRALNDLVLAFPFGPDPEVHAFVYNWLCNIGVYTRGKALTLYYTTGTVLAECGRLADDAQLELLCTPIANLSHDDASLLRLYMEYMIAGARIFNWKDDEADSDIPDYENKYPVDLSPAKATGQIGA